MNKKKSVVVSDMPSIKETGQISKTSVEERLHKCVVVLLIVWIISFCIML